MKIVVVTMLKKVDFPSPLAPTRPMCSPFNRRKDTSWKIALSPKPWDKCSTVKIIRSGVLKNFEFNTNKEVRKHEIKEEMLNSSEANNSMFGKDVLDEYGIKREENGEYVMNNQPNEKER